MKVLLILITLYKDFMIFGEDDVGDFGFNVKSGFDQAIFAYRFGLGFMRALEVC